jgi:hypothetical protein
VTLRCSSVPALGLEGYYIACPWRGFHVVGLVLSTLDRAGAAVERLLADPGPAASEVPFTVPSRSGAGQREGLVTFTIESAALENHRAGQRAWTFLAPVQW